MTELKGFKFKTTLVLVFKEIESEDKAKYHTFYSHSKAETIIDKSDIDDIFESSYTAAKSDIQNSLGKASGWIIDSVIKHNINTSYITPWKKTFLPLLFASFQCRRNIKTSY